MSPSAPGHPAGMWDPDIYTAGPPHQLFADLRRSDPVHWQDIPGQQGYWAVLRHPDVVAVARQPELFSAQVQGVIVEDPAPRALESMQRMLLAMDPPEHGQLRRPVAPSFTKRRVAEMEAQVRDVVAEILDEAAQRGTVEFVQDVAAKVPSRVFGQVMGLPMGDVNRLHHLAEQLTSSQDPELAGSGGGEEPAVEMAMYALEHLAGRRRSGPADPPDLTDLLLGCGLDEVTFASFFVQLVTAGNDTTKTLLTAGLLTLLKHPDQLAELREDPSLWPSAIEEMLRYDNPLHYFRRTAVTDTELGGRPVAAGDKVVMLYTSANRDEAVFADPQRFDIHRNPNPHLAFGIGEHFCLGAHLARLEARVFFEELTARFSEIEPAGEAVRVRSNLNNAYRRAPIALRS